MSNLGRVPKFRFLFSIPEPIADKVKKDAAKNHESVTAWILDACLKKLGLKG